MVVAEGLSFHMNVSLMKFAVLVDGILIYPSTPMLHLVQRVTQSSFRNAVQQIYNII